MIHFGLDSDLGASVKDIYKGWSLQPEHIVQGIRELLIKKCSIIMDFF